MLSEQTVQIFSSVYVCVLLNKIKNWMCHSFREVILPVMVICHILRCKFSRVTDSFSISRTVLKHGSRNSSSLIATTTDLKAKTQSCETEQQCSVCKCLNIYMCVKHQSFFSEATRCVTPLMSLGHVVTS